jgi:hypothetical protein
MTDLWNKYNQTRLAGDKKTANKLLQEIIDILRQKDQKFVTDFTDNLCKRTLNLNKVLSNNGTEVSNNIDRIQHPLFKEIILPILADKYLNDSPLHIKWIGQFEQFFYSDYKMTQQFLKQINIDGYFSTTYFFEKSFAIDNNQDTLNLLLRRTAQDIEFNLHELPFTVLAEPNTLNSILNYFENYWNKSNNKEKWKLQLTEWQNIAKHWTKYFAEKEKYSNFMEYQEQQKIELC